MGYTRPVCSEGLPEGDEFPYMAWGEDEMSSHA